MPENYITRMKREAAEKDAKLAELEKKVASLVSAPQVEAPQEVVEAKIDDRDVIIPVWIERIGQTPTGQAVYQKHDLPKREALEALVEHYIGMKNKAVPSPSDYIKMNDAVVYARITKRDVSTGRKMTVIKDLPLWIAADRAIEGKVVELVSKEEYDAFYAGRGNAEDAWKKEFYEQRRRQALDMLTSTE